MSESEPTGVLTGMTGPAWVWSRSPGSAPHSAARR